MDVIRRLLIVLLLTTVAVQAQVVQPATTTGSLSAVGSVTLNVSGYASIAFQLTGTFVATVTFEGSIDGAIYQAINVTPTNSTSATTTATTTGVWVASVGGLKYVRARVSAYTSGTVVATLQTALAGGGSGGGGGGGGSAPSGTIAAAVPSTVSPVAVKDNAGNLAYPTLDVSGNLLVAVTGAGSGGTSSVDGSGYTAGTTAGTPLMGARDDAGTTACAEDKNCIARLTSTRALMVDGSAVTQPVSAASLPLPTGAATLAKQPALGTAGVASADVVTIQGIASMTKLLVTPDSVALPANQSTNVAQVAGTTTDTNSGVKSAGTLRVVLATDQPALTNKLLVTPDSVALPANQSVNVAQLAGTATDTNSGAKSAGTMRVVLATDQPALTNKLLVTPDSVALPANQSVNVSQINGVTTTMGNGISGTGVQRVTLASDSTGQVALAAGSAVIGHVIADTGSTTAVTGTVANNVTQFGGTNVSTGTGVGGAGIPRVTVSSDSTVTANAGTGTFAISATALPLPTLAATSTKQSDGTQKTQIVDGAGAVIASTSNNLNVQCANCSGSGASATDQASFTAGSSVFAPAGGQYNATPQPLTSGTQGMIALGPNRSVQTTLYGSDGREQGTATNPQITRTVTPALALAASTTAPVQLMGAFGNRLGSTGDAMNVSIRSGADTYIGQTAGAASPSPAVSANGCYLQSAASTNATSCFNRPGNFYGVRAINTTATLYYLRLYNLAAAPTCSSATGFVFSVPVPPAAAAGGANGITVNVGTYGLSFTTGLSFCLTGGATSTDNTSAATGVFVNLAYK